MRQLSLRCRVGLVLVMIMLLAELLPIAAALAEEPNLTSITDPNDYLTLEVNQSGRFQLQAAQGVPRRQSDNGKKLLGESFTTFRVNGQDYIFGNTYGLLGASGGLTQEPQVSPDGSAVATTWTLHGVEIVQTLQLISDQGDRKAGNLLVSYSVKNNSGATVQLGTRILLDTLLGQSDAAPLMLLGEGQYLTNECELSPAPGYWRAVDLPGAPGVMTFGQSVAGEDLSSPDRMVLAHWAGISQSKWDYQVDENLNFADAKNRYGTADSAVALYWSPLALDNGQERTFATLYGLGDVGAQDSLYDYDLRLLAPDRLTLNGAQDGYANNPFVLSLEVDTSGRTVPLTEVEATIDLSPTRGVLQLVDNESMSKTLGYVMPDAIKTLSWRVQASKVYGPRAARFSVDFSFTDPVSKERRTRTATGMLLVPSVAGDPPPLQVLGVTPSVIHLGEANRQVTIRGGGFDILHQTNWTLTLARTAAPNDPPVVVPVNNEKYVQIYGDQVAVSLPDSLFGSEPRAESYLLRLDAGELGAFTQTIAFTRDNRYLTRSYGLLVAYQEAGQARYKLQPVASETALSKLRTELGSRLLLEIRGNISAMQGTLPGGYQGEFYQIDPGAVINGKIQYHRDGAVSRIYGEKQIIVYGDDQGNVRLQGLGGLDIPGFSFFAGNFRLDLKAGTEYSLTPSQTSKPVAITWDKEESFNQLSLMEIFPVFVTGAEIHQDRVNFCGKLSLLADLDATVGDLTQSVNVFNAGVDIKRAEYQVKNNGMSFTGLEAEGTIGLLDRLLPIKSLEFGARAWAYVNSFEQIYEIGADIKFLVISFEGKIQMKSVGGVPVPDSIHFMIAGSPGLPLVPPYVVAYLTQGGGGFVGLADTLAGRFNAVPPLKLYFVGGMSIAKVLSLKNVTQTVGFREMSFLGDAGISIIPVLKDVGGKLVYDDSTGAFQAKLGAKMDVLGILVGDVGIAFRYMPGKDFGLFGPVWAGGWGTLQTRIPDFVPLVGGKRIEGVSLEISSARFYGDAIVCTIPMWIEYRWGSTGVTIGVDKPVWLGGEIPKHEPPGGDSMSMMLMGAVDGQTAPGKNGQLVFGSNFHLVGTSENSSIPLGADGVTSSGEKSEQLPQELQSMAMGMLAAEQPVIESNGDFTEHLVHVQDLDNGLLMLRFVGDVPGYENLSIGDISVTRPDGSEYTLVPGSFDENIKDSANANCLLQTMDSAVSSSGMTERLISIGLPKPQNGTWVVRTRVSTTSVGLIDAKNAPKISQVEATSTDPSGHSFEASWQTSGLQGDERVALLLCSDERDEHGNLVDPGVSIAADGSVLVDLPASSGFHAGTLPPSLASGEYYLRAVLYRPDAVSGEPLSISSAYSSSSIRVVDQYQPVKPGGLQVTAVGNGCLQATWEKQSGIDGYLVELLDQNGYPVEGAGVVQLLPSEQKVAIGGTFQAASVTANGEEGDGEGLPAGQLGLVPGKAYKLSLTAYREVNGIKHYSQANVSDNVLIPLPAPPQLGFGLLDANGATLATMTDQFGTIHCARTGTVTLRVNSDQALRSLQLERFGKSMVEQNDLAAGMWEEQIVLQPGEQRIDILAINQNGDAASHSLRINLDDTAPPLQLEVPRTTGTTAALAGRTEPGASVTVDKQDATVTMTGDGTFLVTWSMGDSMADTVTVTATDAFGNNTSGTQQVVRSGLLARVELQPRPEFASGIHDLKLDESPEFQFQLVGYDADDRRYDIPKDLTKFEVLAGEELLQQTGGGEWKALSAGRVLLSAGFRVSDDFCFYDTAIMDIRDSDDVPPADNLAPRVVTPIADQSVEPGESISLDLANVFEDPEGEALVFNVTCTPVDEEEGLEGFGLLSADGIWSYTATDAHSGQAYLIEIRATDAEGKYAALSFVVTVPATLRSIAVTNLPTKTEYVVAQGLDLAGLAVTGTYTDDSTTLLTIGMEHISGFDNSEPDEDQLVTITYGGKTAAFAVDIIAKELVSITVTNPPTKTEYVVGESLNLAGLEVAGFYNDDTSATLPITLGDTSGFDSRAAVSGQVVTVIYGGKTATFMVDIILPVYTVTFHSAGGTAVSSQTVEHGNVAARPAAPTRPGYSFSDWYLDSALSTRFDFATEITADTVLYAKWIGNADPAPSEPDQPTRTAISGYVQTLDDARLEQLLRNHQPLVLTMTDRQARFSPAVLRAFSEAGLPLRLETDGLSLGFPPEWLHASVGRSDTVEIRAEQLSEEQQAGRLAGTRLQAGGAVFEVCGKVFDLSMLIHSDDGISETSQFGLPIALTVDLADLDLTTADIAQLTGVRLELDGAGNLVPVALGGEYDPVSKTFTFYTDHFSLYSVMQQRSPSLVISLTPGSNQIVVNGETRLSDIAPQLLQQRTMVPLRFISEAMGADVSWMAATKSVVIQLAGQRIELIVGKTDPAIGLDAPAQLVNGRTMVPLRYISEALAATVTWEAATGEVHVSKY